MAIPPVVVPIAVTVVFAPLVAEMFAAFVGFVAFVGPVASLTTVGPEMLDGLVVAPFRVRNTAIAIIPTIGFCRGRSGKEEKPTERQSSERGFAKNRTESQSRKFHKSLQERARAGFGMTSWEIKHLFGGNVVEANKGEKGRTYGGGRGCRRGKDCTLRPG